MGRSYLILIGNLIIGLIIIALSEIVNLPNWLNVSFIILPGFIVVNLLYAHFFKLKEAVKQYWALNKIMYLLTGMIFGCLIAVMPLGLGLIIGKITISDIVFNHKITILSFVITLTIVAWEELWFRGILLNYCRQYLSPVHVSIIVGLLFMLVHLLNPEINLMQTGVSLFFAGAFLTILYFHHKTIWLPMGIHFGNNYFHLIINTKLENDVFFGSEGFVSTMLLASLFILYLLISIKFPNSCKKRIGE